MKNQHTDITIVLDRSGSMASVASDTIGGFNRFLEDQQKAPGTANISLHQFDHEYKTVLNGVDVKSAPNLSSSSFVPRGSTALTDAIGRSIVDTGARIDRLNDADKPEKVVFVIITDGQENASKEYNQAKVHEMITHQRDKYAWEFVFLGANQDAIKAATNMGITRGAAMTYASNSVGTTAAFAAVACNLVQMRSGKSKSMDYTDEQRRKQRDAGATH